MRLNFPIVWVIMFMGELMMRRILPLLIAVFVIFTGVTVYAAENNVFLCLQDDTDLVISNDANSNLKYSTLEFNGTSVTPIIGADNITYMPFESVAKLLGMKNAAEKSEVDLNNIPKGYYKIYWGASSGGKNKLTINGENGKYEYTIGEKFSYMIAGKIQNTQTCVIDNILYVPADIITDAVGGKIFWEESSKNIYLSNGPTIMWSFVDRDYLNFLPKKKNTLRYQLYSNIASRSDFYLMQDGYTISSVSKDMDDSKRYYSASRYRDTVYYIDEKGKVCKKKEGARTSENILFQDSEGKKVNVTAYSALVIRNHIFGLKTDSPEDEIGYIFKANLDGSNFEIISKTKAYNLLHRESKGIDYLYYADGENNSDIHFINLKYMDDYKLQIFNDQYTSLMTQIQSFAIGDHEIIYKRKNVPGLKYIKLNDTPEEFEIQKVNEGDYYQISGTGSEAGIKDIISFSYDNELKLTYFIGELDNGNYGAYYYRKGDIPACMETYAVMPNRLALIRDMNTDYFFVMYTRGVSIKEQLHIEDGKVNMGIYTPETFKKIAWERRGVFYIYPLPKVTA